MMEEFDTSSENNRGFIPNYGKRDTQGERISTGFLELTLNQEAKTLLEELSHNPGISHSPRTRRWPYGVPLGMGTLKAVGARLAITLREFLLDHRIVLAIKSRRPTDTPWSQPTDGLLLCPVDHEVARIASLSRIRLPCGSATA